jgi:hypothetical protein
VGTISCAVKEDELGAAQEAACRIAGFHPGVQAALDGQDIHLSSPTHDAAALRLLWRSALLNETLLARGADRREAVLKALLE